MSGNEGQGNHSRTTDQTEGDDPFVSDRIDVGADERGRDHQMSKGQPVRAICKEGKLSVCDTYPLVDSLDPGEQVRRFSHRLHHIGVKDRKQPTEFGLQRKSCDATQH